MSRFVIILSVTSTLIATLPAVAQDNGDGGNAPIVNDTPTSAGHMYTPGTGQPVDEGQSGNVHSFDFDQAPAENSRIQNTDE